MIFVTVGMYFYDFSRFIRPVDEMAEKIEEKVIVQLGETKYIPKHCEHILAMDDVEFNRYLSEASVVLAHAGAGTVLNAIKYERPLVIVPRRQHFEEHIDDHQLQISKYIQQRNRAIVIAEPTADNLLEAITAAKALPLKAEENDRRRKLVSFLRAEFSRK